jgi:hypothetical protein
MRIDATLSTAAPHSPTPRSNGTVTGVDVPQHSTCVDCGGRCHLGGYEPEDGWQPGDIVFYRCEDCLDRWDIVLPDTED